MAEHWSIVEVELIIAEYFSMLEKDLAGIKFNKSELNKKLQKFLPKRSHKSIEYKHQNISAVLAKNGYPYIKGYAPAWNFQKKSVNLEQKVLDFIDNKKKIIESSFELFVEDKPFVQITPKFENWLDSPPENNIAAEPAEKIFRPIKINYLEREQRNRNIGNSGEQLVFTFEKWRLNQSDKPHLADKVEWVSREKGDGAGFDILSKNLNGSDKFIEVKSTKLTKETPIFFSNTEYDFSKKHTENYWLYRVFDIQSAPRMFEVNGRFDEFCQVEAVSYKGLF